MSVFGGKCKKCGAPTKKEDLVDGLCYNCFFSAETVMDSIMDDLGIPQLMKISSQLNRQFQGKRKASSKEIVDTLLQYDEIDIEVIHDLISGLPLSSQNKETLRTLTAKEYARRHPVC